MITVFDVPVSPYAQKVKLALLEKGLPFEVKRMDLSLPSDELRKLSPRLEVPVLTDGALSLCDSSIIVEYLEDAYPEHPLLPASASERARARGIEELCDTEYEAIVWGVAELNIFQRASGELKEAMLARASRQVAALNARLEAQLQGQPWLNGAQPGLADIAAYPHVNAAASQGNKPTAGGPLDTWLRAFRGRPSAQRIKQDVLETLAQFSSFPQRIASGQVRRQYRDHRLEWMIRSGGLSVVEAGIHDHTIRFSEIE